MAPTHRAAAWLLAACACTAGAADMAATWRCGNTYTDQPCPNGRMVDVDDARSPAQARAAQAAAQHEAVSAARMASERKRREAAAASQRPVLIGTERSAPEAPPKKAAKAKGRKAPKNTDYFTVRDPQAAGPKAKRRKG